MAQHGTEEVPAANGEGNPPGPAPPRGAEGLPKPTADARKILLCAGAIVVAGLAVYWNSFRGVFLFDDMDSILGNSSIKRLWPIWPVLKPPPEANAVLNRPLVNLSLAVNYAIDGDNVRGYHAVNLAVHLFAALTLFGIVRRTLLLPQLRPRYGEASAALALAVALIWTVHPLQTEAVTYVIQRTESMAGLFYLLTLYCVLRGAQARRARWWYAAAVAACLLGAASKEILVTAPVVVLLYDRTFLCRSFREVLRRRWAVYAGLGASWALLAAMVIPSGGRGPAAGFGYDMTVWEYARTQFGAIVGYLRLCFWPHPLIIDYGSRVARGASQIVPHAVVVALLLAATGAALRYRPRAGFLAAWFFLTLAPSSSVIPLVTQTMAEKRMYLPLAGVVALVVVGAWRIVEALPRRTAARTAARALLVAAVALLAFLTHGRNRDYLSEIRMWSDVVRKRPRNPRAQTNLGLALILKGDLAAGERHCLKALVADPNYAPAYANLARALEGRGDLARAEWALERAIRLEPRRLGLKIRLAKLLVARQRADEAHRWLLEVERDHPDGADVQVGLGHVLADKGRYADAVGRFRRALALAPNDAHTLNELAWLLATCPEPSVRNGPEAVALARRACDLATEDQAPRFIDTLAAAYAESGQFAEAVAAAQRAAALARKAGKEGEAEQFQARLELYRQEKPYRQPPPPPR
jgi:Flp pilus assembly protein TadD